MFKATLPVALLATLFLAFASGQIMPKISNEDAYWLPQSTR